MRTRVLAMLYVAFAFEICGLVASAGAQVKAGSPEDKAFQKIDAEQNADVKIGLLLDFEKQFPQSEALRVAYTELVELYQQKQDSAKAIDYSEKTLKLDPNNLVALVTATYFYSLEGKPASVERAIQYGEKAMSRIAVLKKGPAQIGYSDEQWKRFIEDNESLAKNYLSYAKGLKR